MVNISIAIEGTGGQHGKGLGIGMGMLEGASTYHTLTDVGGGPLTSLYSFPGVLAFNGEDVVEIEYKDLPIGALTFFSRQLERELKKLKGAIKKKR